MNKEIAIDFMFRGLTNKVKPVLFEINNNYNTYRRYVDMFANNFS